MKESDERLDKDKAESDRNRAGRKMRGRENWAVNMVRMRIQRESSLKPNVNPESNNVILRVAQS